MAGNSTIYISREKLENVIKKCYTVESVTLINQSNNQTRYELTDDENALFKVDVYYKMNNTVNIVSLGSEVEKSKGDKLRELICKSANYTESVSANFCENISKEEYLELIKYLGEQDNVKLVSVEDKGFNGIVNKYETNFGDKATITFYPTNGKLRFQGYMMDLYVATRTFVLPLSSKSTKVIVKKDSKEVNLGSKVDKFIANRIPNYYNATNQVMKSFISDSLTLQETNITLSDYSSWTFSILKVLEFRIKEILLNNSIVVDNSGFRSNKVNIFIPDNNNPGQFLVNANSFQVSVVDKLWLEKCYSYFNQNRHGLFHTNQQGFLTRVIATDAEAKGIIIAVCGLLEQSFNALGK